MNLSVFLEVSQTRGGKKQTKKREGTRSDNIELHIMFI